MKKQLIIILIIFIYLSSYGQTDNDFYMHNFLKVYQALQNMLEGKDSLNYEKAVFITENAYHNNYFKYEDFKNLLDFHTEMINAYAENVRKQYSEKYKTLNRWEQKYFKSNTDNWAIFKYITDTAFFTYNKKVYYKEPYAYTYQDPYGSLNWENTQVMSLLMGDKKQGNCYSLAVLFKLFSDRLKSDARLTVTPHHIYIQNRNERGDFYNVELASKSFPGDGSIQTLTYTTNTSIKNGMAQCMLTDKEAVALNLIYLAKGYQHKYKDNTNNFLLQCAELAFKYDTLSLNALLLKAEIAENRLWALMKENKITSLSKARVNPHTQELLKRYETQLSNLYVLGYREVPKDIERIILAAIQHREEGNILKNRTTNPFAPIHASQRYATLSNGLFDETHEFVDTIQYAHVLFNSKTKKIIKFLSVDTIGDYKVDPVVFALSVDPLSDKYPNISPYAYCLWKPIIYTDPDGRNPVYDIDGNYLGNTTSGFKGSPIIFSNGSDFKENMTTKSALKIGKSFDNETKLSNSAKSNILTHITNQKLNDGADIDQKINITIDQNKYGSGFNAKYANESNLDIRGGDYTESFETTVENIRNVINIHEVKGHVFNRISGQNPDHYKAYEMQIANNQFNSTTRKFKSFIMVQSYLYFNYAGKNFLNNPSYNKMFYKFGGYNRYMDFKKKGIYL